MKRALLLIAAAAALAPAGPRPAAAWEAETTHAGLTERAAMASRLHARLRKQFAVNYGLLAPLTVPPADARDLYALLRRYNPIHGYVPDSRGRLTAIGWLVAGSVIADQPAWFWGNHFYDPTTGKGLDDRTLRSLRARLAASLGVSRSHQLIAKHGVAAPDWVLAPQNPMNLSGFLDQYALAVRARTPNERGRNLAGALVAAGALLHVLQDMGSPSHVRDDLAAHVENLAPEGAELGSRYERIAALVDGRLGVPPARKTIAAKDLRTFYTSLAAVTANRWFSAGTLPASFAVPRRYTSAEIQALLQRALRRPQPLPTGPLDLVSAARLGGQELADPAGVCLARYQVVAGRVQFSLDDECMAEQIAAVLPEVAGYSAGLLDWLFRGELTVTDAGAAIEVAPAGVGLGAGELELFAEDAAGVRTPLGKATVTGAATGSSAARVAVSVPAGARRIAALFRGVDAAGQPLAAAGLLDRSEP
ncbi:MAG TPA: hypothetical protein VL172_18580 [Kofleriaceae bacterium]|nr:hypothetical protein [Kofleriaceae bacterium]